MDSTLASVLVAVIGLLGAIVGHFQLQKKLEIKKLDNAKEIEDLKNANQDLIVEKLDAEVGLLNASLHRVVEELDSFRKQLFETVSSIKNAETKYVDTQEKADRVLKALGEHVEWVNDKFRKVDSNQQNFESTVVQLGKQFNDLIMVKGTKGKQ